MAYSVIHPIKITAPNPLQIRENEKLFGNGYENIEKEWKELIPTINDLMKNMQTQLTAFEKYNEQRRGTLEHTENLKDIKRLEKTAKREKTKLLAVKLAASSPTPLRNRAASLVSKREVIYKVKKDEFTGIRDDIAKRETIRTATLSNSDIALAVDQWLQTWGKNLRRELQDRKGAAYYVTQPQSQLKTSSLFTDVKDGSMKETVEQFQTNSLQIQQKLSGLLTKITKEEAPQKKRSATFSFRNRHSPPKMPSFDPITTTPPQKKRDPAELYQFVGEYADTLNPYVKDLKAGLEAYIKTIKEFTSTCSIDGTFLQNNKEKYNEYNAFILNLRQTYETLSSWLEVCDLFPMKKNNTVEDYRKIIVKPMENWLKGIPQGEEDLHDILHNQICPALNNIVHVLEGTISSHSKPSAKPAIPPVKPPTTGPLPATPMPAKKPIAPKKKAVLPPPSKSALPAKKSAPAVKRTAPPSHPSIETIQSGSVRDRMKQFQQQ